MIRASPMPAIGAAKNSPNPMCFWNDMSVCRWIWSAGASSAVPVSTTPSAIRAARPPGGAIRSPGSVRGRSAYATVPITASANGSAPHSRQSLSRSDVGVVPCARAVVVLLTAGR